MIPISGVDGRSDDLVRLARPRGDTIAVHPYHMHAAFATVPDVLQHQVTHTTVA